LSDFRDTWVTVLSEEVKLKEAIAIENLIQVKFNIFMPLPSFNAFLSNSLTKFFDAFKAS